MAANQLLSPPKLSRDQLTHIRRLLQADGERATAAQLGISRQTLGRLLAGLPIQRGTAALVRVRLASTEARDGGVR